ncbi:hypothetical protein TGDOM2_311050 [Toxoplasma gondii GAB2-2007-GAL-DOM2]|uniref:Uncharacterized protein n=5 Tax=Toxoplasma gondii TaxID=5811 RepID=A0A086QZL5_TOXGO|nr:hypothetical protein TGDOM2_311050 [Toxoplasma gondii GAB2-2007-GAL-DOM2]KFG55870.1 hypothetical protein TGFOU_311050 [Toxoplasma gondii FOU]KFH18047.1 hypothetical protein TGMAS_311050 [Toxoplasma gondii MAS]PUA91854.1 hypothetical protein TGBR9_311050 [Toxoplasma gondii TgCATBr9]RQX72469.1 hypothetical protein TGCAST_311050 [Toxoplasma gondii CAST]
MLVERPVCISGESGGRGPAFARGDNQVNDSRCIGWHDSTAQQWSLKTCRTPCLRKKEVKDTLPPRCKHKVSKVNLKSSARNTVAYLDCGETTQCLPVVGGIARLPSPAFLESLYSG